MAYLKLQVKGSVQSNDGLAYDRFVFGPVPFVMGKSGSLVEGVIPTGLQ